MDSVVTTRQTCYWKPKYCSKKSGKVWPRFKLVQEKEKLRILHKSIKSTRVDLMVTTRQTYYWMPKHCSTKSEKMWLRFKLVQKKENLRILHNSIKSTHVDLIITTRQTYYWKPKNCSIRTLYSKHVLFENTMVYPDSIRSAKYFYNRHYNTKCPKVRKKPQNTMSC